MSRTSLLGATKYISVGQCQFPLHPYKTITTTAEIMQVTTISLCEGLHASNLITQAMEKVSKEGVIIKEGRTIEDEIEIMEGLWFDCGFISLYFKFVTDMKRDKIEFGKPFILLSRKKILLLQDILPSLGTAAQARRPIIEDVDVDWEALVACLLNKFCGQLQVAAVKAPGFIDNRKSILGDLAFWTRGTVLT